MESTQLYTATQTHYSTEPRTTIPDYDPVLLLLAIAGDVHPNHCSVCFKNVTSQGTSYLCTKNDYLDGYISANQRFFGNQLVDSVSISSFAVLNTTRLPENAAPVLQMYQ